MPPESVVMGGSSMISATADVAIFRRVPLSKNTSFLSLSNVLQMSVCETSGQSVCVFVRFVCTY